MKKEIRRPKIYRIVIIFATLFLLLVEIYTIFISFQTVSVSSFDVEVAASKIEISEDNKTFSINNNSFVKTSREYKKVLAVFWNKIAVVDIDNQLKLIDENENVLVAYTDFSLDIQYIVSATLFEEQNMMKVKLVGNKDGKAFDIDYCYDKNTKATYLVKNF